LRILGIDPGTATLGYGLVENGKMLDYGVITTDKVNSEEDRLLSIFRGLEEIMHKYNPDEVAVEKLFFSKNIKTAITVSQARGVSLLVAAKHGKKVFGYTPLQVKQGIASSGTATKKDVQFMVKMILGLDKIPKPDDAADALAIAIVHCNYRSNNIALEL
tara:strand:- start:450 stop:929 length:480 start_codon:yes stop_codon:yes gene_type:complete